jgi:hypothetical protein
LIIIIIIEEAQASEFFIIVVDVDPAPMMGDVLNGFPLAVNMRLEITLLSSILSKSNLE